MGPTTGLVGTITVSDPAGGDGAYFDAGEQVTLTATVTDENGLPVNIDPANLERARLYIYGPLDPLKSTTSQNLMRVTSASEYLHLDEEHEGLSVDENVATFETGVIADEEPGTYRAVLCLRSATETYDRSIAVAEFQVKTPSIQTETVAVTQCAPCHQGASNGHFYFHHSDTSDGSAGSYEYDDTAIKSCKACHNQDGYARTTDNWDPARPRTADPIIRRVHGIHMGEELASPRNTHRMVMTFPAPLPGKSFVPTDPADPGTSPIKLVHGLTSGAEARVISSNGTTWLALGHVTGSFLIGETMDVVTITDPTQTNYNNIKAANKLGTAVVGTSTMYDSEGAAVSVAVAEGYFADYTTVVFPPDVRNCTVCHVDDSWKEKPSQYACGACHDNIWWGDAGATPEGFRNHEFEIGDIKNGVAGADKNIGLCSGCHAETTLSIADSHKVPEWYMPDQKTPATQEYSVALALDPPQPSTGYLVGTAPKVYVTVTNNATGLKVNPETIDDTAGMPLPGGGVGEKWSGFTLCCSGPRSGHATPVLTTSSTRQQVSVTNGTNGPWVLAAGDTFVLSVNGAPDITVTAAGGSMNAAAIAAWLNGDAAFSAVAKAVVSSSKVQIKTKVGAVGSMLDIKPCAVATKMSWDTGRASLGSTTTNDLRERFDALWDADPKVSWNPVDMRIEYQLDDVAGLAPGTYAIYVTGYKVNRPEGFGLITFEVGTATPDKFIATNCTDCHRDRHMHLDAGGRHPVDFSTDYCKNCHDWRRENQNSDVWAAFGADPIVKKVHGIHRGHYLQYPEKIYINNPIWGGIIFPQDVRNCTKCHSSDTTGTWNTKPSRLACGACHDSDATNAHMLLQTMDPTPTFDPVTNTGGAWSGDETESCSVCHGEGKEFEAKKVHQIADPYVPPYPR